MEKNMNTFEANLEKLEKLTTDIKRSDISLEDALKDFEEGIKLAAGMEKQLDDIEGKIQILMNEPQPMSLDNPPQMDLSDSCPSCAHKHQVALLKEASSYAGYTNSTWHPKQRYRHVLHRLRFRTSHTLSSR